MREVNTSLLKNIASNTPSVSLLWHIKRTDLTDFYFTDSDVDIDYDGNTYKTLNSGTLSSISQSAAANPDNFEFNLILNSSDIDKEEVRAGLFDYADIYVYAVNRDSVDDGEIKLQRGKLGEVRILDDNKAQVEFRSLTQLLLQGIGRVYGHECDADLGDSRCNVTLATYTVTGTLTSVINNQKFRDTSRTESDDHFNYGLLTWTSGDNDGLSMEVKDYDGANDEFTLVSPMPFTVQAGDTYSVYRGCDKIKSTCKNTFANIDNFRGFAEIPGIDLLIKVPDVNSDAGLHD